MNIWIRTIYSCAAVDQVCVEVRVFVYAFVVYAYVVVLLSLLSLLTLPLAGSRANIKDTRSDARWLEPHRLYIYIKMQ